MELAVLLTYILSLSSSTLPGGGGGGGGGGGISIANIYVVVLIINCHALGKYHNFMVLFFF